jgi:type II secretory pathway pseudopilin PulG
MEKENTFREGILLVIVMFIIIALFTIVGYWDSISERREKDREAYFEQSDAQLRKQQMNSQKYRTIGNAGNVNDHLNPKTKLSDLEADSKKQP